MGRQMRDRCGNRAERQTPPPRGGGEPPGRQEEQGTPRTSSGRRACGTHGTHGTSASDSVSAERQGPARVGRWERLR